MIPFLWLRQAAERISPYIKHTPLSFDTNLGLALKWENHQVTGSFKARGALNKVLSLQPWELQKGLVAASAGNHGQGVALAARLVDASVTVFASEHAVPAKVEAMRALGAVVRLVPGGYAEAENAGLAHAAASSSTWISPYNDGQVIAGQGTLGLELCEELSGTPQAVWVVPAGGGGLVSGLGASLEACAQQPRLVAVQSQASPFLHALYHKNSQEGVSELASLADGLAGPVEANSLTVPLTRRYVDEFQLVSEEEIAQTIAFAWRQYNEKIEGSAATALAAVLFGKVTQRPAVVILSGGNIEPEVFAEIIDRFSGMVA